MPWFASEVGVEDMGDGDIHVLSVLVNRLLHLCDALAGDEVKFLVCEGAVGGESDGDGVLGHVFLV
jgi:hypothetical protein